MYMGYLDAVITVCIFTDDLSNKDNRSYSSFRFCVKGGNDNPRRFVAFPSPFCSHNIYGIQTSLCHLLYIFVQSNCFSNKKRL